MFYNNSQDKGFFNYDIQFTGGTSIEVNLGKEFENEEIANLYKETLDIENAQIQKIGNGESVTIKTRSLNQDERIKITDAIINKYGITEANFSVRDISATISNEMKKTSFLAIIVSCIAMLLYVSLRFKDFKIGASSIIALLHDALIVLAFYAIFRIPLNEAFIAAILTVLGYSINATIIIFDRMRENRIRTSAKTNEELMNGAIKQSFRRSLFTSLTTFFMVIGLYIFGVESVKIFALPIAIGIVCGTYSSLCIAGSVWYIISNTKKS
ncbi:MAG: protein translocase subunit SecF [Eubacteriales bacterium]|nr:protein translocase subunit SecF [Eubacteriales bacterium]